MDETLIGAKKKTTSGKQKYSFWNAKVIDTVFTLVFCICKLLFDLFFWRARSRRKGIVMKGLYLLRGVNNALAPCSLSLLFHKKYTCKLKYYQSFFVSLL